MDSDPRAIQQIDFTANLHRAGNTTLFFIIEEAIVTVSDFYKELQKFRKCVIEWFNFYRCKITQYNSLSVKLSNSQLSKLKSPTKNKTEEVLRLSLNIVGKSDDETNFPHKLSLTNRQVANLRKAFANYLSTDILLSKTQLSKMIQSGGFLGRLLGPLLKT